MCRLRKECGIEEAEGQRDSEAIQIWSDEDVERVVPGITLLCS